MSHPAYSFAFMIPAFAALLVLSGCQTTSAPSSTDQVSTASIKVPARLSSFNIQGKIGVVSANPNTSSGSAYYAWAQDGERFAIELTGALGIGRTLIQFDGQTATLTSEQTGTVSAADPEALLAQATGWQAPITELPYWISGSHAPSDEMHTNDALGRLHSAANGDWQAAFYYSDATAQDALPNRIKITQATGDGDGDGDGDGGEYKITFTIYHTQ